MRRHGTTLLSVFVFVGAILITACGQPYHQENERYVFVATNINLPYWQEAQAGVLDAAKALGAKGELVGPTGDAPNAEPGLFPPTWENHPPRHCLHAAHAR